MSSHPLPVVTVQIIPQHLKTVKSVFPEWPVEKLECVQLLVKIGLSAKRINEITGVPAVVPYTIKQRGLW